MLTYVMGCVICGTETEDVISGLCDNCTVALDRHKDDVYEALMIAFALRHKRAGFKDLKAVMDKLGITEREV